MKRAVRVTTKGAIEVIDISVGSELTNLQAAVGGNIQPVDLTPEVTMWCNEEGKLIDLPFNPYAQLYWNRFFGAGTDAIMGDVIFTGGVNGEGDTTSLGEDFENNLVKEVEELRMVLA